MMATTLDMKKILCCYVNQTNKMQVTRITNIKSWYLEHVVFPGERFLFEAPAEGELEIYYANQGNVIMLDKLPCEELQVDEGSSLKAAI